MYLPKKVTAIIKVTENCNYNCKFCFYASKGNAPHKNMDLELCKKIINEVAMYNINNGLYTCNIVFHGGEPLLMGKDFFKSVIDYENELKKEYPELVFDNTVQTNGSLIDDEWVNFFKENNFIVGISLDGDEDLNYHKNSNGKNVSIRQIIDNYHKLDDVGINVGILSVITNNHCADIDKFYRFIIDNKIKKISILPCVNDDENYTVSESNLINFYKGLFDLYFNSDFEFSVREFNDTIKRSLGYGINTCKNCKRIACGAFLTFDSKGNIFFCDEAYNKDKAICNIESTPINEVFTKEKYINMRKECTDFFENNCKKCEALEICGGDCYRNDITDKDGIRKNRFCNVSKEVYKYISDIVLEEGTK